MTGIDGLVLRVGGRSRSDRLADQAPSATSAMSPGRAPAGSLTVASAPLRDDPEFPKGFSLRVVDGRSWLRGYRCDDEHRWSPEDRFVFALPSA